MRIVIKIAAIPLIIILSILNLFLKFVCWASYKIFIILSLLLVIFGIIMLFKCDVVSGITMTAISFSLSPFGIFMLVEKVIRLINNAKAAIKYYILAR